METDAPTLEKAPESPPAAAAKTPTKAMTKRLKKKLELAAASPSVKTPDQKPRKAQKGKAKASAEPRVKALAEKRTKKQKEEAAKKGKGKKKEEEVSEEEPEEESEEEAEEPEEEAETEPKQRKPQKKPTFTLPPPLGHAETTKTSKKENDVPGWTVDGKLLWKAYGDLSRMPKTASIVAVSLNNGPIQTGDAWHREQGHFCQDAEDWIWWSSACVPALRAIASGAAGASAFSPSLGGGCGAGLATALPKKPVNLVHVEFPDPDAAVDAAEISARAALAKVPAAPPRPLFLLRSDAVMKGAMSGKMAHKLESINDAAAAMISADDPGLPFVVVIFSSKSKEGLLEAIAEHVAPKLGMPAPDAEKSTLVAGSVGKRWFEEKGGSLSRAPPSDVDEQFALGAGWANVLEMPEAFAAAVAKPNLLSLAAADVSLPKREHAALAVMLETEATALAHGGAKEEEERRPPRVVAALPLLPPLVPLAPPLPAEAEAAAEGI